MTSGDEDICDEVPTVLSESLLDDDWRYDCRDFGNFDVSGLRREFLAACGGGQEAQAFILKEFAANSHDVTACAAVAYRIMEWAEIKYGFDLQDAFVKTQNPLFAWLAWDYNRRGGHAPIDWALCAFDEWADKLLALAERPPSEEIPKMVGDTLGFAVRKNGTNPIRKFYDWNAAFLDSYVFRRRVNSGEGIEKVKSEIANSRHVDPRTIARRLKQGVETTSVSVFGGPRPDFLADIIATYEDFPFPFKYKDPRE